MQRMMFIPFANFLRYESNNFVMKNFTKGNSKSCDEMLCSFFKQWYSLVKLVFFWWIFNRRFNVYHEIMNLSAWFLYTYISFCCIFYSILLALCIFQLKSFKTSCLRLFYICVDGCVQGSKLGVYSSHKKMLKKSSTHNKQTTIRIAPTCELLRKQVYVRNYVLVPETSIAFGSTTEQRS